MCCWGCGGAFWGVVLVILGVLFILSAVFHFQVPVFRIFFAILFIWMGISVLSGGWRHVGMGWRGDRGWRSETEVRAGENVQKEYSVIFGKGNINLTGVTVKEGTVQTEINTVFGSTVIKMNPGIPAKVILNSAFSSARMPDGNVTTFGEYTYKTPSFKEGENALIIKADVVFGSLEVIGADLKL